MMNHIHVWVGLGHGKWKDWVFILPDAASCERVKAGLQSFYSPFPEKGYVQLIHYMGGGIEIMFDGCYGV